MVIGVLEVYDRINVLEAENAKLKAGMVSEITAPEGNDPLAGIKARILQFGREKIVDDALDYWRKVSVARDDDGQLKVMSYESWLKDNLTKVPEFMSVVQLKEICKAEFKAEYEKNKNEAMNDFLNKETEKDDEE